MISSMMIGVRSVDTAEATESVWSAAQRMRQRAVGSLVVIDHRRHPIGIVTDRDLVERVLAEAKEAAVLTVGEIMTRHPTLIHAGASPQDAAAVMEEGGFRRLPVVNDQGELTGLVTLDDLLMDLARQLTRLGRLIYQETPAGMAKEMLGP